MKEIDTETGIYDLRDQIKKIKLELDELGSPTTVLPEIINSTNVIRLNQYFLKSDKKKSDLIFLYAKYSKSMDLLLSSIFEIQKDLQDILKEQSFMIKTKTKTKTKTKSKSKK